MRQGSVNYKPFGPVIIQGELRGEVGECSGLQTIVEGHWPGRLILSLTRDSEVRAQAPRQRVRCEPFLQALPRLRTRSAG